MKGDGQRPRFPYTCSRRPQKGRLRDALEQNCGLLGRTVARSQKVEHVKPGCLCWGLHLPLPWAGKKGAMVMCMGMGDRDALLHSGRQPRPLGTTLDPDSNPCSQPW